MTQCCCVDAGYYESATLSREKLVKARKSHKCTECGDIIEPGLLYERAEVLYDGHWDRFKTCARCCNIRTDYFKCSWSWGGLVEDFRECYDFDYRNGIPPDFAPCKENSHNER